MPVNDLSTRPLRARATDPRWVSVCVMWDKLKPGQQLIVEQAMRCMVEMNEESPDDDASTPSQSAGD